MKNVSKTPTFWSDMGPRHMSHEMGPNPTWRRCFFGKRLLHGLMLGNAYQHLPRGAVLKPQGMVNWHPLGTIWHPLEGPGWSRYVLVWRCSSNKKVQDPKKSGSANGAVVVVFVVSALAAHSHRFVELYRTYILFFPPMNTNILWFGKKSFR